MALDFRVNRILSRKKEPNGRFQRKHVSVMEHINEDQQNSFLRISDALNLFLKLL